MDGKRSPEEAYLIIFLAGVCCKGLYGTILGSKSSSASAFSRLPVDMELGFRAPLCFAPPSRLNSPALRPSASHASSTQVTLSKLSVNPREMPITTGPMGLKKETNVAYRIVLLLSTTPLGRAGEKENKPSCLKHV